MRRRDAIAVLAAGVVGLRAEASPDSAKNDAAKGGAAKSLDRFLPEGRGAAVLLDVRERRLIAVGNRSVAARSLAPPGSALKPFVLTALLSTGKLHPEFSFPCPGRLRIGAKVLDCSHPKLPAAVKIDTALAYSCNCFVAHVAEMFGAGELAREAERVGLSARTGLFGDDEIAGRLRPAAGPDASRLQALGEDGVLITVAGLALAYRGLALKIGAPEIAPIRKGLEGAVEYGTAQNARVAGVAVAGKTGTSLGNASEPIAWFAGFLPSGAPEVAMAVMVPGRSGGADAAPVAGRILAAYRAGRL